jgi:transcriptional regulator GlxA family with amidase domain
MRVAVLVLEGAFDTGLATVLDTLDTANALADRKSARFGVSVIGFAQRVRTSQGFVVKLRPAASAKRPDVVIVPALGAKTPETILARIGRPDVASAGALLRKWRSGGARVAAACTGTFVLAASGLLDGRRATTTWWLAPTMREHFPHIELDDSRMVVDDDGVTTAGAALAHVDLALWLIRRRSPSIARATARHFVFDERPSQASYVLRDFVAHADPLVERFEQWARKHLAEFSMLDAARSVGASERTLERRLQSVLGKSPVSYVQDLRVERAVHALETTDATVDDVATLVGYRDAVTLRTLLRKKTGRGVRELRDRKSS